MKAIFLTFILLILINSCVYDTLNFFQGFVFDSITNRPIPDVKVETIMQGKLLNKYSSKTDSVGFFRIVIFTGLPIPVKLLIHKPGYSLIITKELKTSNDILQINMVRNR